MIHIITTTVANPYVVFKFTAVAIPAIANFSSHYSFMDSRMFTTEPARSVSTAMVFGNALFRHLVTSLSRYAVPAIADVILVAFHVASVCVSHRAVCFIEEFIMATLTFITRLCKDNAYFVSK